MSLAGELPALSLFSTGATHSANPILPPDLLLNPNEGSRWEGRMFPAVKQASRGALGFHRPCAELAAAAVPCG